MGSLIRPGRPAGFDPSHPASNNVQFSGVAVGANFINILKGKPGALTGTPAAVQENLIGPVVNFTGTTLTAFSGQPNPGTAPASPTMAGIFTFNNSNPGEIFATDDGNGSAGYRFEQFAGQIIVTAPGIANFFSGVNPVVGHQYFAAVSRINGTGFNWVLTDLTTGQVQAFTTSSANTSNPGTSGNFVVGNMTGGSAPGGKVAAVYYASTPMSLAALTKWAQDPWLFWYPRVPNLSRMFSLPAAGGGVAYTLAGAEGAFTISGQVGSLFKALKLAGAEGSFTISGQAATMFKGKLIPGAAGAFIINGQASVEVRGIKLAVAEGAFVINGGAGALAHGFKLAGGAGAFTISGQAAKFPVSLSIRGAQGAFTINGAGSVMSFTPFGTAAIAHSAPFLATPGTLLNKP